MMSLQQVDVDISNLPDLIDLSCVSPGADITACYTFPHLFPVAPSEISINKNRCVRIQIGAASWTNALC